MTDITAQPASLPRRYIAAATIGNALDFYDFAIYNVFTIQIGHAFFAAKDPYTNLMLSLFVFGVGFITRPIGGLVIGAYADRVGRKAALVLTLSLTGLSVVALALVPTYAQIGVWATVLAVSIRLVQGFALGGETGSASAFLLEASAPEHRGLSVSWQGASQGIAGALGALVGLLLTWQLAPAAFDAYGWRIAFLIGGLALPFGLILRRALPETLGATEAQAAAPTGAASLKLLSVSGRIILIGAIVFSTRTVATYIFNYMTTYAQATLHMATNVSIAATGVSSVAVAVGVLIGGVLSDRLGRRPVMIWPNLVFLVAIYPAFLWIVTMHSAAALWTGIAILSVLTAIPAGAFYTAFTESLPKHIRSRAFSVVYAVTIAIFGATTQSAVTWLIHETGNKLAPAWYLIGATLLSQFAMMAIRESAPVKRGG
ncbi:MAG TPA: MFS transporter [Rhizomicrobium sp.]|jgi:MFS family permease|nr:MFS transporter [Rhizomicrobium sp.]